MTATSLSQPLDPKRRGETTEEFYQALSRQVVGQPQALEVITTAYQVASAGLSAPGRPLGSFLFLGPTGTGKTKVVEALAQTLLGSPGAVVKVDCAEFQHSHEISKLIGSPPGYLGHRETHAILSQKALDQYHQDGMRVSFVLFDEIEKASDSLWNLLLGILDKGTLTLGDNTKVDFSQSLIFMTSNLGAKQMAALTQRGLGFAPVTTTTSEKLSAIGDLAARKKFTPEFLNRLDHIVTFKALTEEDLAQILELELSAIHSRFMTAIVTGRIPVRFLVNVTPAAKKLLIHKGYDPGYGARYLKRVLEANILQPVVNLLTSDQVLDGDTVLIDVAPDSETFQFTRRELK